MKKIRATMISKVYPNGLGAIVSEFEDFDDLANSIAGWGAAVPVQEIHIVVEEL